ncbi:MAG: hypothetical protein DMG01_15610 [Acidobacteria bacterium]|nr:MAG: hypothetical protein DMG01_15610 [Acidobacteriota bacterium]
MRLRALKRHWDRLARQDPLWAVLTDPGKRDGGWDVDQFFRAGTEELSAVLQRAARLGVVVSRRRALDFGCGVGRVTQAMAGSFDRCDGVDISASMLRLARRHNRDPARCSYHLNVADDLARSSTSRLPTPTATSKSFFACWRPVDSWSFNCRAIVRRSYRPTTQSATRWRHACRRKRVGRALRPSRPRWCCRRISRWTSKSPSKIARPSSGPRCPTGAAVSRSKSRITG